MTMTLKFNFQKLVMNTKLNGGTCWFPVRVEVYFLNFEITM